MPERWSDPRSEAELTQSVSTVSDWLSSLKRGSSEAAQKVWQRYYEQLVRRARRRLGNVPQRAADAEDVAQEAFANFFTGIQAGRFPRLDDRHDLWQILLMLADRRAKDRMRRELAQLGGEGGRGVHAAIAPGAHNAGDLAEIEDREPTPQNVADLVEVIRASWKAFADRTLRNIALDKLQGYNNVEIAQRQQMALRSVERKLQLIRRLLREETRC